jgi:hypothetical protein
VRSDTKLYSLLSHYPTSCTPGFTPRCCAPRRDLCGDLCGDLWEDLLRALVGAVDFDFAFMRTLLQVLAVAAMLLVDAAPADASDCMCDRLSAEGCGESAQIRKAPAAPPLWCERTDDPRCMPASTHGTSVNTLVPVAMSWAQPIRWNAPPRTGIRWDVRVDGDARSEHSRRVERPPR